MTDRRRRAAPENSTGIPAGTAPGPLRPRRPAGPSPSDLPPFGLPLPGSLPGGRLVRDREDDNPFAAPPEGRPEQPWRPRGYRGSDASGPSGSPDSPRGDGGGDGDGRGGDRPEGSSPDWGSRWSSRQPGRQSGGFGSGGRPEQNGGQGGAPGGMRWDPTDPVQRRARYALVIGGWGLIFAFFGFPWLAVPLGALAVYWGVGAIRGKPGADGGTDGGAGGTGSGAETGRAAARPEDVAGTDRSAAPEPGAGRAPAPAGPEAGRSGRPQLAAAVTGLVTGILALLIIAAQFTVQLVYRDYFVCVEDALTNASRQACERHLPEQLRPLFGDPEREE
ncbi:hypothetical protein L7D48_15500 [Streptomyces sp. S1A]|uniref:hypothetical protein n=1 Tax=Streptomyces sp. ICN903 TaxID=2964654 RepID=UPI001EDC5E34|nr:hypothetical protein [Streptomyces sp. ICN903]MCG3041950.1 hypothetical protein [Streptomyces sp. ICN903]